MTWRIESMKRTPNGVYVEFEAVDGDGWLRMYVGPEAVDAYNVAKIVLDALNGVAWDDDAQVVSLTVSKLNRTRSPERLSVSVTECS